jgi:hypothetical protein
VIDHEVEVGILQRGFLDILRIGKGN